LVLIIVALFFANFQYKFIRVLILNLDIVNCE